MSSALVLVLYSLLQKWLFNISSNISLLSYTSIVHIWLCFKYVFWVNLPYKRWTLVEERVPLLVGGGSL